MENELAEKLHSISFRATKAECLDLSETIDVNRQAGPLACISGGLAILWKDT